MINSTTVNKDLIVEMIASEIKNLVAKKYEELKKDFLAQLEKDKAADLAGISIWMMKQVQINSAGENIIITLRTENHAR